MERIVNISSISSILIFSESFILIHLLLTFNIQNLNRFGDFLMYPFSLSLSLNYNSHGLFILDLDTESFYSVNVNGGLKMII